MARDVQPLGGVVLANEEFLVRSYHCSQLKFPACDGFLSVTNRRVLFHGHGDGSRIVNEVPLDAVSGVSTYYGSILRWGYLLMGVIGIILGIAVMAATNQPATHWNPGGPPAGAVAAGCVVMAIGAFFLWCGYCSTFSLRVHSSTAQGAPIFIGEGSSGGLIGNGAAFSVTAYPTEQTDKMMLELGAMITDLQTMGDFGIERWKK